MKANLFYVKEDEKRFTNYGRLEIDGKVYILKDQADFTGRCLPFKEEFELSAPAVDLEGNEYSVYWIFEEVEDLELDQYDYENVDRVVLVD